MESMIGNLNREGKDLTNATEMRLSQRPLGLGKAYEDFGSSFTRGSQGSQGKATAKHDPRGRGGHGKFKLPTSSPKPLRSKDDYSTRSSGSDAQRNGKSDRKRQKAAKTSYGDSEDGSEDEMDLLSSQPEDHPSTSQKPVKLSSNSHADSETFYVDSKGRQHEYDKRFPPEKSKTLKGLKFSRSKDGPSDRRLPDPDVVYVKKDSQLGRKSASSDNFFDSPPVPQKPSQLSSRSSTKPLNMEIVNVGTAKPRPKPRPVGKTKTLADVSNSQPGNTSRIGPASSTIRATSGRVASLDQRSSASSSQKSRQQSSPDPRSRSSSLEIEVVKSTPETFPFISPQRSSPDGQPQTRYRTAAFPDLPLLGDLGSKSLDHTKSRPLARVPSAFPISLSPTKDQDEGPRSAVHILLPKAKEKKKKESISLFTDEERGRSDSSSLKEKEKIKKAKKTGHHKAKAFPMSTQVLQSIGSPTPPSRSRSPSYGSTRPGKRNSEGGSGDDRISKRSRKELDALLQSPTRNTLDEGDSISISPDVDPRTLCPYCDTPLPKHPSPLLLNILKAIKKKSVRDPRPSNPLGLKASLGVFIAACQRHRFESDILPEAESKGWPKTIEWDKVSGRIMRMKPALKALIEDPGDNLVKNVEDDNWEIPFSDKPNKGAKARSSFWAEVMAEVKQKGTRAVAGVRAQFANFEKAQPGYYGELGSVIIHQTLYDMFPPSSMDPKLIAPLTANEFVQRILVPEVALHLILQDMCLKGEDGVQEALTILRESSTYGVAMFPEDGGEWGSTKKMDSDESMMAAGDQIVLERARKRRKELEEEEEREEEERRQVLEREKGPKRKGRGKAKATEDRSPSPLEENQPPPKPRPRPIPKSSSSMSLGGVRDPPEPIRSSRPNFGNRKLRSRSRSSQMDTDPASGFESAIDLTDSDNDNRTVSEEQRRSPSASETRPLSFVKPISTRSTSRGLAGLNIGSESESSSKAVANAIHQTRNRSRSVASGKTAIPTQEMEVDEDDSDDAVEVVDELIAKTPVQRRYTGRDVDDQDTPKASFPPGVTPRPSSSSLPPLEWAKLRRERSAAGASRNPLPPRMKGTDNSSKYGNTAYIQLPTKKSENFGWLLDRSSQE